MSKYFSRIASTARRALRLNKFADLRDTFTSREAKMRLTSQNVGPQAIAMVRQIFDAYSLPNRPKLGCSGVRAARLASNNKVDAGVITVHAEFRTKTGVNVGIDVPVEVRGGELIEPSVIVFNGSPRVIAQSTFDNVVASNTFHEQARIRSMYSAPLPVEQSKRELENRRDQTRVNKGLFSASVNRRALRDAMAGRTAQMAPPSGQELETPDAPPGPRTVATWEDGTGEPEDGFGDYSATKVCFDDGSCLFMATVDSNEHIKFVKPDGSEGDFDSSPEYWEAMDGFSGQRSPLGTEDVMAVVRDEFNIDPGAENEDESYMRSAQYTGHGYKTFGNLSVGDKFRMKHLPDMVFTKLEQAEFDDTIDEPPVQNLVGRWKGTYNSKGTTVDGRNSIWVWADDRRIYPVEDMDYVNEDTWLEQNDYGPGGKSAQYVEHDYKTFDPARNVDEEDFLQPAEREKGLQPGDTTSLSEEVEVRNRGGGVESYSSGSKVTVVRDMAGDGTAYVVEFDDGLQAVVESSMLKSAQAQQPPMAKCMNCGKDIFSPYGNGSSAPSWQGYFCNEPCKNSWSKKDIQPNVPGKK